MLDPALPFFVTPLIVAVALFMENLDATIIATSLPAIARSMSVAGLNIQKVMAAPAIRKATSLTIDSVAIASIRPC